MGVALKLTLYLCFINTIFFSISETTAAGGINWWCSQTPHPETCRYHVVNGRWSSSSSSISQTEFLNIAVHLAIDEALDVLKQSSLLKENLPSGQEKALWADCVKFYKTAVFQLNRSTAAFTVKPSILDIRTWLTAALVNHQMCQNSFHEMKMSEKFQRLLSSTDLTALINNAQAISVAIPTKKQSDVSSFRFPKWLSRTHSKQVQVADMVVAQDGSGDFRTINEALCASSSRRTNIGRFVIYVKTGIYSEYLTIDMPKLSIIGDGIHSTIITGNRSTMGNKFTTFNSATVVVNGDGFTARDITFLNTAGPGSGQAVALLSNSDQSAFYRCGFQGYQDTLFVASQRQFFQECQIFGTVDFIFGNAAAVFQNCEIYFRKPVPGGGLVATAQGRISMNDSSGFSIQNSKIMAAPDLQPVQHQFNKAYLGRPWKPFSRTVYLQCFLDSVVDPAGWQQWNQDDYSTTLFYGEYRNSGPGSSTEKRVRWPGYRILNTQTAQQFTVSNFIGGQSWLPDTNIPFADGL